MHFLQATHRWGDRSWHWRAWLSSSAVLALLLATRAANAAPPLWPAARIEYEYGILSQNNTYQIQAAGPSSAIKFEHDHREAVAAAGWRGTLGFIINKPGAAVFPRLSVAHAQTGDVTWTIPGQLSTYDVRLHNQLWTVDVGAEIQLVRRILLVEAAFGGGYGHSTFAIPAMDFTEHNTASKGGFLMHFAAGLRAPLKFPLTLGSKVATDSMLWFGSFEQWFVSAPSQRVAVSVFIEIDPFYGERMP